MEQLGGKEAITLDDLNLLPYTNAFIKESNRLHSPVPHYPRINQGEFSFGEYTFPKGTFFVLPLYHLNKDPYTFGDSNDFKPERYLEQGNVLMFSVSYNHVYFADQLVM